MIVKGILAIGASIRLRELEGYLKTTEKYLQKAKTDFEAWFDEQANNLSPEERDEFGEFYSDTYWDYAETFPRILRNSFLISAHSLLEHEMGQICKRLKKEQQIPVSWHDLKYDVLEQFKQYCKLAGLPLLYNDQIWQAINNHYMVRNCIVHNSGLIKGSKHEGELRAYITRKNIISRDTIKEEIALTEQFCREVIKTIWAFLSKVYDAYELQKQDN
ncbi:MAG: hypothetical protein KAV98_05020 [Dehalococcoidia bacterium]|nr:hypothetical protein [Dehalococcoidia bacterium]